jgi:anti-sigma regulatory factor (Ser/Thr protein kinase)
MESLLRVDYRIEMLPVIRSFVAETAKTLGATDKESWELSLAAEETSAHIMEGVPAEDAGTPFEIYCRTQPNGLEYAFRNLGVPVDLEALPDYDTSDPEEILDSIDGLRLFLARKLVSRLEHLNLGNDGWCTVLFKEIATPRLPEPPPAEAPEVPTGEKIVAGPGTSDDAQDIVELAYQTYRYSYSKEVFYYTDQLSAAIDSGQILPFIGRTQSGQLVAHLARMIDPQCPAVAEMGAIMIRPEYRRSSSLLVLVRAFMRYIEKHSVEHMFQTVELVTGHTLSQKLCAIFSFRPMGLKVSTHTRAKFTEIDTVGEQRESTIYAIRLLKDVAPFDVFVPPEHQTIATRLFSHAGLLARVRTQCAIPDDTLMEWSVAEDEEAQFAELTALGWGSDFHSDFKRLLFELSTRTIATTLLLLPTWEPPPAGLDAFLADRGFFFGGFIHCQPDRWFIKYARLMNQPFSFDQVLTYDPIAEELKSYTRHCFERLIQ